MKAKIPNPTRTAATEKPKTQRRMGRVANITGIRVMSLGTMIIITATRTGIITM